MNKKWVLPMGIKVVFQFIQHAMAATVAICLTLFYLCSEVFITQNGERYHMYLDPSSSSGDFYYSDLFKSIFTIDVENIIAEVVDYQKASFQTYGIVDEDNNLLLDINAYANRNRDTYEEKSALHYNINELKKWYRDGITYSSISFSVQEFMNYFKPESNLADKQGTFVSSKLNDVFKILKQHNINYVVSNPEDAEVITVKFLNNDYLSWENIKLEEAATSWEEYGTLVENLLQAMENVDSFYSGNETTIDADTNLMYGYYIKDKEQDSWRGYSNSKNLEMTEDGIISDTFQTDRYVGWRYYATEYETNTRVSQQVIQSVIESYGDLYPKNSMVYIAVDTRLVFDDAYMDAYMAYQEAGNAKMYLTIAGIATILWGILFLFLSTMTGRARKEEKEICIVESRFDKVKTELALICAGVMCAGIIFGLWIGAMAMSLSSIVSGHYQMHFAIVVGIIGAAISMIFSFFWLSLARRIKLHNLWKNSFCYILLHNIMLRLIKALYQNSNITVRVLGTYVGFVLANILLGFFSMFNIERAYTYSNIYAYGNSGRFYLVFGIILMLILASMDGYIGMRLFRKKVACEDILKGIKRISQGELNHKIDTTQMTGENLEMAEEINHIGDGIKKAVETSMKDERMKADLITNVSHDIKTPLTSIINYVDLLKRENIDTEPTKGYIEVLDAKSQRLKQLTDDLVEASKISSGNIILTMEKINLTELLKQSIGEFSEKFDGKSLAVVENYKDEPHMIYADSRRIWRVIENLFNNIYKYAMEGTRVYIDIYKENDENKRQIILSVKNISAQPLNISPEELTERFIRGDESRTTEGSGLGLSIAKSLIEAQNGKFDIVLDGDLFKVIIIFGEEP